MVYYLNWPKFFSSLDPPKHSLLSTAGIALRSCTACGASHLKQQFDRKGSCAQIDLNTTSITKYLDCMQESYLPVTSLCTRAGLCRKGTFCQHINSSCLPFIQHSPKGRILLVLGHCIDFKHASLSLCD